MLFSVNWLNEHIQGQLPAPDKLEQLLNMHIFEVEKKERKKGDWIFDVAVLTHRGDAVSHRGLARELAALLKRQMKKLPLQPLNKAQGSLPDLTIKVQSLEVYRYAAEVLDGLQRSPTPNGR